MRTFERQLPVRLTQGELEERGWSLAEERRKQRTLEAAKKASADAFKDQLDVNGEEIDRLAEIVHSKSEYRPVLCHEQRDYKRGVIEIVRRDTGEIVETRVMTEAERQRELREIDEAAEAVEQELAPTASGEVAQVGSAEGAAANVARAQERLRELREQAASPADEGEPMSIFEHEQRELEARQPRRRKG